MEIAKSEYELSLGEALEDADARLDGAWRAGAGLDEALARAKQLSRDIGRDPVIEDAKVTLARVCECDPSTAFEVLRNISQRTNRKVSEIAREVVFRDAERFPDALAG